MIALDCKAGWQAACSALCRWQAALDSLVGRWLVTLPSKLMSRSRWPGWLASALASQFEVVFCLMPLYHVTRHLAECTHLLYEADSVEETVHSNEF